jgi:hypothetical protein
VLYLFQYLSVGVYASNVSCLAFGSEVSGGKASH